MKRSEINRALAEARAVCDAWRFALPDWAEWSHSDHRAHPAQSAFLARRQIGWDVTDFGSGQFATRGLTLNGGAGARAFADFLRSAGPDMADPATAWQAEAARLAALPDPLPEAHQFMELTCDLAMQAASLRLAAG